jgi:MscS family membrane protein
VSGLGAGLGLGGLAFSLAAQDTVSNLFAFTTIVSDRPFVVGEYIKTPLVEGTVEAVGVRNVRVRQTDQAYVTVPNSKLTSAPIINWA